MEQEARHSVVTAVGHVWLALGILLVSSAATVLAAKALGGPRENYVLPALLWVFAGVQILASVPGVAGGLALLGLRAWARPLLEGLTWFLLVNVLAAAGLVCYLFFCLLSAGASGPWPGTLAVIGLLALAASLYGIRKLLGALRGAEVREALQPQDSVAET